VRAPQLGTGPFPKSLSLLNFGVAPFGRLAFGLEDGDLMAA
jgi:hypothetical protein